jgi:hypothetical protein
MQVTTDGWEVVPLVRRTWLMILLMILLIPSPPLPLPSNPYFYFSVNEKEIIVLHSVV